MNDVYKSFFSSDRFDYDVYMKASYYPSVIMFTFCVSASGLHWGGAHTRYWCSHVLRQSRKVVDELTEGR